MHTQATTVGLYCKHIVVKCRLKKNTKLFVHKIFLIFSIFDEEELDE